MNNHTKKIKVCFFSRRYKGFGDSPDFPELFDRYFFWTERFKETSVDPFFIIGSDKEGIIDRYGYKIYLIRDRERKHPFSVNRSFIHRASRIISDEQAAIVHCHNLNDIFSHQLLRQSCKPEPAFLIQDHGSVYKWYYKFATPLFRKMDGFIFNSPRQESAWVSNKIFPQEKVHFLPEGSSRFAIDQHKDDLTNGAHHGRPKILWVGNLDQNKDPLTILKGIKRIIPEYPDLRLGMVFREGPLEVEIREFIRENHLQYNVKLIGSVPFEKMPEYYIRYDYFILGSRKEGSGYAAIEATSFGLVPILSNIPSFIDITGNGKIGVLFDLGDEFDLSIKLKKMFQRSLEDEKEKTRGHFLTDWSPEAMVRKYEGAYERLRD